MMMVLENLQSTFYVITLILAALTGVFSYLLISKLWRNRSKIDTPVLIVFILLSFGYACFALAELSWYMLYGFIERLPSASMPDLYWFVGSLALVLGYGYFSIAMYKEHGHLDRGLILLFSFGLVGGIILYYILSQGIVDSGSNQLAIFFGYYYPISSLLILIASVSVYLFFDKLNTLGTPLLMLAMANLATFIADSIYSYYSFKNIYGLLGVTSDLLYIISYLIYVISFYLLWKNVQGEFGIND